MLLKFLGSVLGTVLGSRFSGLEKSFGNGFGIFGNGFGIRSGISFRIGFGIGFGISFGASSRISLLISRIWLLGRGYELRLAEKFLDDRILHTQSEHPDDVLLAADAFGSVLGSGDRFS